MSAQLSPAPIVARCLVRNASLSPLKGRPLANQIRGLRVARALDILNHSPKRAARIIGKALNSAIANAEEKRADIDALVIGRVEISDGITIKRIRFGARGRVCRIKRRRSHILVSLADESAIAETSANTNEKAGE